MLRELVTQLTIDKWTSLFQFHILLLDESYVYPDRPFDVFGGEFKTLHDIGLIKLSEPIRSGDRGQGFAVENSICLPQEDYREAIGSYALTAGYGGMGANKSDQFYPLQMSYRKRDERTEVKPIHDFVAVDNGGTTCSVSVPQCDPLQMDVCSG